MQQSRKFSNCFRFFIIIGLVVIFIGIYGPANAQKSAEKIVTLSAIENVFTHNLAAAVLVEAYQRIGYKAVIDFLPAQRSLVWANEGKTDGDVARIKGTEKKFPNLIPVPTPVTYFKGVAFTKRVSKEIKDWDDLKGLRIGIIRGIRYSVIGTKGMEPILAKDMPHLFKLLDIDRIQIAVATLYDGKIEIARNFKNKGINIIGEPLHSAPLYHFVHIKNKAIVPQLDIILREMTKTGEVEAIHKRTLEKLLNP